VSESPSPVKWLVIDAGAITAMDFSAGHVLLELQKDLARQNVVLALTRVSPDFRADLDHMQLTGIIGAQHIFSSRKACIAAYQTDNTKRWIEKEQPA